jgi:hypothetical protein
MIINKLPNLEKLLMNLLILEKKVKIKNYFTIKLKIYVIIIFHQNIKINQKIKTKLLQIRHNLLLNNI